MSHQAPFPADEGARIRALLDCNILDTDAEAAFDGLTRSISQVCNTPVALVSLVDRERQWFKSRLGLDDTEMPRELAFCGHVILYPELMVVPDTHESGTFRDHPLVTGDPHIRFYAGAPLELNRGERVGALCVIDWAPRNLTGDQLDALRAHAVIASEILELRRSIGLLERELAERDNRSAA
ncbi:MAG: GAF domain-containing protein [Planctomycetota bacterium]